MATATERAERTPPPAVLWLFRGAGAVLAAAMAAIHGYLWLTGYEDIPLIGPAFLANTIGGGLLALALLVVPRRLLGPLAALGALFTFGTLGALLLSLTVGLFGFTESVIAPLVPSTLAVEALGTVVLAALALLLLGHRRELPDHPRSGA